MNSDIKQNKTNGEVNTDKVSDDGDVEIKYTYVLDIDRGTEEDGLSNSHQSGREQNSVPSMELNQEAFPKVTIKTENLGTLLDLSSMAYIENVGNISSEALQFPNKYISSEGIPADGVSQNYWMNGKPVDQQQTYEYVYTISESTENNLIEEEKSENEVFYSTANQATCSSYNTSLEDIVKVESPGGSLKTTVEDIVKVESLDDTTVEDSVKEKSLDDTLNTALGDIVKIESLDTLNTTPGDIVTVEQPDDTLNTALVDIVKVEPHDTLNAHVQHKSSTGNIGHTRLPTLDMCKEDNSLDMDQEYLIDGIQIPEKDMHYFSENLHSKILNCQSVNNLLYSTNDKNKYCSICKQGFNDLNTHMRIHKRKCHICQKTFKYLQNLKMHLKSHNVAAVVTKQPNTCEICSLTYQTNSAYKAHKEKHRQFPYSCKHCMRMFGTDDELQLHIKDCQRLGAYVCIICKKRFLRENELKFHIMQAHMGSKKLPCLVCSKLFDRKDNLVQHLRTHTQRKVRQCHICSAVFYRTDSFKAHIEKHETSKNYVCCSLCNLTVLLENYEKHLQYHKCSVCEKIFKNRETMKKHMFLHNKGTYLECNICSKLLMTKRLLRVHVLVAHKKKFQCNFCERTLSAHNSLHDHFRTHREHLPITCNVCNRNITVGGTRKHYCKRCKQSFVTRAEFLSHKSVHRKTCHICGKVVSNDSQLQYHHMKFHSEKLRKPYSCEYCSRRFSMFKLLQAHTSQKHSKNITMANIVLDLQEFERKFALKFSEAAAEEQKGKETNSSVTDSPQVAGSSNLTHPVGQHCTDYSRILNTVKSDSALDWRSLEKKTTADLFASGSSPGSKETLKNSDIGICTKNGKTDQWESVIEEVSSVQLMGTVSEIMTNNISETLSQIHKQTNLEKEQAMEAKKIEDFPFQCKICASRFRYLLDLKRHIRNIHSTKKLKNYQKC